MMYQVKISDKTLKQLANMDRYLAKFMLAWIQKNLEGTLNPKSFGKGHVGSKKGILKYRIGSYRLFTQINDNELLILVIEIGHRKDVYK